MKKIDIFGTCFSRELFNYSNNYVVRTYLMNQSIYTIDSNPYSIDLNKISTLDDYKFKNRMLYYDFNKLAFSKLMEKPAEYLLIDLADQSRNVVVLDDYDNVKLTSTSEMLRNLSILNEKFHIENVDDYDNDKIYESLKKFKEIISSLYDNDKIILNIVQLQNEYYVDGEKHYVDENIQIYRRRELLRLLEAIFLELMPKTKVLCTKLPPIIDINHRFGAPHPAHFEAIYYKYKMCLLDALINNYNIDEVEMKYKEKYNASIKLIRKKKL